MRAWAQAGLTHLLCDGPVDPANEPTGVPANEAAAAVPLPKAGVPPTVAGNPARVQGVAAPAAPAGGPRGAVAATAVAANPEGALDEPRPREVAPPPDPVAWPETWRAWYEKISPAPVLWTYHELGADVTGIGRSTARSAFFKQLLTDLRLPKGSSVFWPCAMPSGADGSPLADSPVFASGVQCLSPQMIVVLGETALEDIGLAGRLKPFRQDMVDGKLVLLVPEIETLLHDRKQRASAESLLRAVLASIILQ